MIFTHHAIERYHQRWEPTADPAELEARITALGMSATEIRERTRAGDAIFTAGGIRFVVKRDPGAAGRPVCVTVLPSNADAAPADEDWTNEVIAAAERDRAATVVGSPRSERAALNAARSEYENAQRHLDAVIAKRPNSCKLCRAKVRFDAARKHFEKLKVMAYE